MVDQSYLDDPYFAEPHNGPAPKGQPTANPSLAQIPPADRGYPNWLDGGGAARQAVRPAPRRGH